MKWSGLTARWRCNLPWGGPRRFSDSQVHPVANRKPYLWSGRLDSNQRHPASKTGTLPTELRPEVVGRGSVISAAFIMAAIITISGCQSIPDAPRETLIPVATPCLSTDQLPIPPKLVTDAELLTLNDAAFVLALAADRLERAKYMAVTEALLAACVR